MVKGVKKFLRQKFVNSYSNENQINKVNLKIDVQNGCEDQDSKKISKSDNSDKSDKVEVCSQHTFSKPEVLKFRKLLMEWYDREQRDLPWRTIAKTEADINKRIYAVWVSEVMLQQTQVVTVLPYYKAWLAAWPTVQCLAAAQLTDVHKCWAGLGYYSRATRLHLSAQKVCNTLGGQLPTSAVGMQSQLSGVGRYTAAAVASIACGETVAVVDGNVTRVVARLRAIGADVADKRTVEMLWELAQDILDRQRPGDANQALMELGATVCTPKKPQCSSCPVRTCCLAYKGASGARMPPRATVLAHFTCKTEAETHSSECSDPADGEAETGSAFDPKDGDAVQLENFPCERTIPETRSSRRRSGRLGAKINQTTEVNSCAITHGNGSINLEVKSSSDPECKFENVEDRTEDCKADGSSFLDTTDLSSSGDIEDACWLCLPSSLRDSTLVCR